MSENRDQKAPETGFSLVRSVPLSKWEVVVFVFRLVLLLITHPLLWWGYVRAMRIERRYHPSSLTQAVLLRLGWNARYYDLDPLKPKQMAITISNLRSKPSCLTSST